MKLLRLTLAAACGAAGVAAATPAQAGTYKLLYQFNGGADAASPLAGLIHSSGKLWGTSYDGGAYKAGTVFALTPGGGEKVVYSFQGGSDGGSPGAGLLDVGGTLYGTTELGGAVGSGAVGEGTVFALNPATGGETVVYAFKGGTDGAFPEAALTAANGLLYGTTFSGGGLHSKNTGTVFSVDPATGSETVLRSFAKGKFGARPSYSLLQLGSELYGAAQGGGATGSGTVFQVKAAGGAARLIYSFTDGADGGLPVGNLIKLGGLLYGTAYAYGPNDSGVVFSVNPKTRTESVVYSFQGGSDGANPRGGLLNVGGTLYGTTAAGGATGNGTLFSVNPATGAETVLYSFQGGSDGAKPVGELINADGTLYGTTISGGNAANCPSGCGTVFSYTP